MPRGLALTFAGVISGVSSVFITLILVRTLDVSSFGVFALTVASSTVVTSVVFEWLRLFLMRNAHFDSEVQRVISLYVPSAAGVLIVGVILGIMASSGNWAPPVPLVFVTAIAVTQSAGDLLIVFGRARADMVPALVAQAGRGIFVLGFSSFAALISRDVLLVLVAYVIGQLTAFIMGAWFALRGLPKFRRPTANDVSAIGELGAFLAIGAIANSVLLSADKWLVAGSGLVGAVAESEAAYLALTDIFAKTFFFATSISVSVCFQPMARYFDSGDQEKLAEASSHLQIAVLFILGGGLGSFIVAGSYIAEVVTGRDTALDYGTILASAFFIAAHIFRNALMETHLMLSRRSWRLAALNGLTVCSAAVAYFLIGGHLGLVGVPLSFLVANVVGILGCALLFPPRVSALFRWPLYLCAIGSCAASVYLVQVFSSRGSASPMFLSQPLQLIGTAVVFTLLFFSSLLLFGSSRLSGLPNRRGN